MRGALLFPIAFAIAQRVVKELLHFHKCTARSAVDIDTRRRNNEFLFFIWRTEATRMMPVAGN